MRDTEQLKARGAVTTLRNLMQDEFGKERDQKRASTSFFEIAEETQLSSLRAETENLAREIADIKADDD